MGKRFLFVMVLLAIVGCMLFCNQGLNGIITTHFPSQGEIAACKGLYGPNMGQWHLSFIEKLIGGCYSYQLHH
jgi:hypothetical protein